MAIPRRYRFRIALACIAAFVGIVVVGFLIVERVLSSQEIWQSDEIDLIFRRPPPFTDAAFLTNEFIGEIRSIVFLPDKDGIQRPQDHAGKQITTRGGWRITPGQPAIPRHTVYIFGNSTLLNREVPDTLTIPAIIQQMLPNYRVENRGVYGGSTQSALHDLKRIDLHPGDIVIFYIGMTEGVTANFDANRQLLDAQPLWCKSGRLHQLATIRAICDMPNAVPPLLYDTEWMSNSIAKTLDLYMNTMTEARQYAETHGVRFISALQPHLWSTTLSPYEQSLLKETKVIGPGYTISYQATYPRLSSLVDIDLSHVLDEARHNGEEFYIDWIHVNHRANQKIAVALVNALWPEF